MAEMTKREHLEAWLALQVQAMQHGAALTENAWDDALAANIQRAWSIEFVRGFVLDALLKFVNGGTDVMALTSPEDVQKLEALNFDFGSITAIVQKLLAAWEMYKSIFGRK